MVKTRKVLIASLFSAGLTMIIYSLSFRIFSNPALMPSNIQSVGIITTISTFLIAFLGMKWFKL